MKKTIKKLYKGQVDLRDYDVEKCIKKKEYMEVVHSGQRMVLSPEDLVNKRISVSEESFGGAMGGKTYKLFGYVFIPQPKLL